MSKKKKKFIIDIVPLTRIPLNRNPSFSYLHHSKLPTGTLVEVPLFKRNVEGIVIGARDDFERLGNFELKKINKVIEEKFLHAKQLNLAEFISNHYLSSLGVVLKNFVPKQAKSRIIKVNTIKSKVQKINLTEEQKKVVQTITKLRSKKFTKYLLFGPAGSGKTEIYIHSILKLKKINNNSQFLILVPEKTLTPQAVERYGEYFKEEEIVMLSSNLSKGQFFSAWEKIRSGKAKIIIGTRMAVFAPFKKLGLIVIDEEQDMSFKQWEMTPRYDARTVADELAKIYSCTIIRGSATPSVESYWKSKNKEMQLLTIPALKIPNLTNQPTETIVVDMKKERWQKNYSIISRKLKSEIEYALKNKLQVILFINRQGMSAFAVCDSCKSVMKCEQCEKALIYDREGFYRCTHCSYKTNIVPKCKKCGGIIFKNIGLGTQKVEKEIKNIFSSAKIIIADSQSSKQKDFQENIYTQFSERKADILIGTQMISKGWDLPNVSLIGIIDADNMLTFPDFSVQEKTFQTLIQVAGRVSRPGARFPGVVVVQTFQPENRLIQMIAEKNFEAFFENEFSERKALQFPPFGKIIKIFFQDFSLKKTTDETTRVYEILNKISDIKVTEPYSPLLLKIRGKFRKQLIIKIKENIPGELIDELKKLGHGWIIDIDPISII